jgi:hypothetical protein
MEVGENEEQSDFGHVPPDERLQISMVLRANEAKT